MNKTNEVVHKIGEAVLNEKALETITFLQSHENDNIEKLVCKILKIGGFIAQIAEEYKFYDEERDGALQKIIILSEVSDLLESFKK
jgi:hypothetical protein